MLQCVAVCCSAPMELSQMRPVLANVKTTTIYEIGKKLIKRDVFHAHGFEKRILRANLLMNAFYAKERDVQMKIAAGQTCSTTVGSVAVGCSGSQWVAVGCSVLQCAVLQCVAILSQWVAVGCSGSQWVAVGRSGLLWVAVGCSELQWAAVCYSAL